VGTDLHCRRAVVVIDSTHLVGNACPIAHSIVLVDQALAEHHALRVRP
jgi:hypothetical protein